MRTTLVLAVLGLGLAGCFQPADAQDRVTVLLKISIDPSVGGTAIGAASGTIDGVPASIDEASWTDTHSERAPLFEAGLGVRAGELAEILALFNYGRAGAAGDIATIGQVGGAPLTASFDNYEFWGLEAGLRLRPASGIGPYGTFTGGFRRVSEIRALLRTNSTIRTVTGYEASTVPSFAFGGGMLWGSDEFAMGFEVALRYAGAPSVPAGQALEPASDAGSRWSLPVGVVIRF
jgi:hypothetical protein